MTDQEGGGNDAGRFVIGWGEEQAFACQGRGGNDAGRFVIG